MLMRRRHCRFFMCGVAGYYDATPSALRLAYFRYVASHGHIFSWLAMLAIDYDYAFFELIDISLSIAFSRI